jgi:DNA-binding NtrC family response regulator
MNTEAMEVITGSTQQGHVGLLIMNMAYNAMLEGHYDKAHDLFERVTEISKSTGNVTVSAFGCVNRAQLELVTGDLEDAYELFRQAEQHAAMASFPAIQAEVLILRAIMEERLDSTALIEATAACARDLHARELEMESVSLAVLAASLAAARGQGLERCPPILDSTFAGLEFTRVLMKHYLRMLSVLQERRRPHPVQSFPKFLTQAPTTIAIKDKLNRLVGSDVRILIEGESGTGKSFLARQFHDANGKPHSPYVIVDCTNLEENLFESKLFGHLRGSFTGAISDTVGLVEQANGGTLFLDEIGELPREIQGKLLYTIEEQRYRPVGAKQERRSEFRLIAATNRDIDQMLDAGTLRRDLFFRLAGFRVTLPPLQTRREDIVPLVELRLDQLNRRYKRRKSLRSDVWESLVQYSWPGNVRELNTVLERGYHLCAGRRISLDDLGLGLSSNGTTAEDLSWYSIRRDHLLRVLRLCRGNVAKAAQLLGLNRTTLIYKLKLLDIERKDFAPGLLVPDQEADIPLAGGPEHIAEVGTT